MNKEKAIEDAIIANPAALGFRNASAIRRMRVGFHHGIIDVALFPKKGAIKLVLIEAKHGNSPDAASKVLGQILMYYAAAQKWSTDGLESAKKFALKYPQQALGYSTASAKMMSGGLSPPEKAWIKLQEGEKLKPSEIAMFVAIDREPSESLVSVVKVLREHGLSIGLVVAEQGVIRVV